MRVVDRDPRARAAGGRTPWKQPMTEPLDVVAKDGNKLTLRALDGKLLKTCHIENCVIVSDEAVDYKRQTFTDLPEGTRPSIGEAFEVPYQHLNGPGYKQSGKWTTSWWAPQYYTLRTELRRNAVSA